MNGKVLKISNNDLYGNVDDRHVAIFAAFNHLKYMNKYVIFTFEGEYDKNKLYYGSVHFKNNSIVIFSVNNATKEYIDIFTNSYLSNMINPSEYQIINLSNIEKVELVSYNEEDFDKLNELDKMSIPRITETTEPTKQRKKYTFLYIILIIMILLLGSITYLYLFPEKFTTEYKQLECTISNIDKELNLNYHNIKLIKLDKNNQIKIIDNNETYTFPDENTYLEFKNNNSQNIYLKDNATYQYNDELLELKIIYTEESTTSDYEQIKYSLTKEGYKCQEGKYYE